MFNIMDYKQGEEIKERLDRLEKKIDHMLNSTRAIYTISREDLNMWLSNDVCFSPDTPKGERSKIEKLFEIGKGSIPKGPQPEDEHYFVQEEFDQAKKYNPIPDNLKELYEPIKGFTQEELDDAAKLGKMKDMQEELKPTPKKKGK